MPAALARQVYEKMGYFTVARNPNQHATSHVKQHKFEEFFFAYGTVLQDKYLMETDTDRAAFDSDSLEFQEFKKQWGNLCEISNFNQKELSLEVFNDFFVNALEKDGVKQIKADVRLQFYIQERLPDGRFGHMYAIVKKFGNLLFPNLNQPEQPQCIPTRSKIFEVAPQLLANQDKITGKQRCGTVTFTPFGSKQRGYLEEKQVSKVTNRPCKQSSWPFTMHSIFSGDSLLDTVKGQRRPSAEQTPHCEVHDRTGQGLGQQCFQGLFPESKFQPDGGGPSRVRCPSRCSG